MSIFLFPDETIVVSVWVAAWQHLACPFCCGCRTLVAWHWWFVWKREIGAHWVTGADPLAGSTLSKSSTVKTIKGERQTRVSTIKLIIGLSKTYIWLRWVYRLQRFCTWKKVWIAATWGQGIPPWPSLCWRRWCGSCWDRLSWLGVRTFWFLILLFINNYNFIFINQARQKKKRNHTLN